MNRFLKFFQPQAFDWGPRTLFGMRLGVAVLVFWLGMNRGLIPFELDSEKAHGLARWVPLMWILESGVFLVAQCVAAVGLGLFVFGVFPVVSLLAPLFVGIAAGTLRQSMGDTTHSTQIYHMVLLAIWVGYLWHGLRGRNWARPDVVGHRGALFAALLVLASSYVASGIVKLKASRGLWIRDIPNLAVHMVKSNLSDYYSKPQGRVEVIYEQKSPAFVAGNPNLARLAFGPGLLLELSAFLLVLSRRWALGVGVTLVGMHLGISYFMAIEFWGHLGMLAVLCVLPAFTSKRGF